MSENRIIQVDTFELNKNIDTPKVPAASKVYEVMHMEKIVATISTSGKSTIILEEFMPYDLYLEQEDENDIEVLINNLNNFYHWCASRMLSLDRKYAKELLNSIGVIQAVTDRDRANIALSYHGVSLTDVYWIRKQDENIEFSNINLYDNPLNETIVEISLKGRQMTVTNTELAPDLSTKGCFPKAWIRTEDGFYLLKDGGEDAVKRELLASKICQCFDIPQVEYKKYFYDNEVVTKSVIISSKDYSLLSKFAFDVYAVNHDIDVLEFCKSLDPITYYGMNILDYLIGNTDRHPENWGFLVDNKTNNCVSLYPIMDFNQSFQSYDDINGANCQTVLPQKMTQREAAIESVKQIGLRQIREINMTWFEGLEKEFEMFETRLSILKGAI